MAARRFWRGSGRSTTPSTRSSRWPPGRASTPASSRAARWRSPVTRRRPRAAGRRRRRGAALGQRASSNSRQPKRRNVFGSTTWCRPTHTPHCARIQPAALARGLADVVERLGVTDLRAVAGHRDRSRAARSPRRARVAGADRAARHRGLHARAARPASTLAADEQLDDRHRTDPAEVWERHRLGGPRDRRRHRARVLLRPAHRRRPHRHRRPQRALPLRARAPTSTAGCPPARSGTLDRGAARRAAAGPRRPDRARLVRRAGGAAGLGGQGRAGPHDRPRLGRRLRRPRRHRDQPGRPHARRPGARRGTPRSPTCRGSGTGRATGNPSRCAGSACAASTSPTSWPTGTRRADARTHVADRPGRRHRSPRKPH